MKIHVESLEIDCIIGLLDFEREHEQKVIINLDAEYDYCDNQFLDYSKIVEYIEEHLKDYKYLLLEDALLGLRELILEQFPIINILEIQIMKPDILNNCSVGLSDAWENSQNS